MIHKGTILTFILSIVQKLLIIIIFIACLLTIYQNFFLQQEIHNNQLKKRKIKDFLFRRRFKGTFMNRTCYYRVTSIDYVNSPLTYLVLLLLLWFSLDCFDDGFDGQQDGQTYRQEIGNIDSILLIIREIEKGEQRGIKERSFSLHQSSFLKLMFYTFYYILFPRKKAKIKNREDNINFFLQQFIFYIHV